MRHRGRAGLPGPRCEARTIYAALKAPLFHGDPYVQGTPDIPFWDENISHVTELTSYFRPSHYDARMDSNRTFFITTVTWQRRPIFRDEFKARPLLEVFFHYRQQGKFLLHEFVIMPDHLHLLITPAPSFSLERAVQFIKGGYSYRLGKTCKIPVWQQSFTNHRVRDAEDFAKHRVYIQFNPVRAGLVERPEDYPYSSLNFRAQLDELPHGLDPRMEVSA